MKVSEKRMLKDTSGEGNGTCLMKASEHVFTRSIVLIIKLRRMRLLELVARKGVMRKTFYILIGKSQRIDCLGELRVKEMIILKMDLKE